MTPWLEFFLTWIEYCHATYWCLCLSPWINVMNSCFLHQWDAVMEIATGDHGREAMKALCDAAKWNTTSSPGLEIPDPETLLDTNGQSSTPQSGINSFNFSLWD